MNGNIFSVFDSFFIVVDQLGLYILNVIDILGFFVKVIVNVVEFFSLFELILSLNQELNCKDILAILIVFGMFGILFIY